MNVGHESVLPKEVMEGLGIAHDDIVVDATAGGAGHLALMLAELGTDGILIGIDADPLALDRARAAVAADRRENRPVVHLVEDNFRNLDRILARLNIARITKALFDLGWSGYQLTEGRGFSFQGDEPLFMTYGNPHAGRTAADIVNSASEDDLAEVIRIFGEERFARSIARSIASLRAQERILSTGQLVRAIEAGVPAWYRRGRIHPATKTFQALRIATNDELGAIREGLSAAIGNLAEGGRLAVITFHSIEDRAVKTLLMDAARAGKGRVLGKKVITASKAELARNPRARSAKLRLFEAGMRSVVSEPNDHVAYA